MLAENLPSALLSVWRDGDGTVWAVGADNGSGPLMLRYSEDRWSHLSAPTDGDLWWVRGVGSSIYVVGAGGRVLKGTSEGVFSEEVVDPSLTFYGIWGSSEEDLWAVGGNPDVSSNAGAIWHHDGSSWSKSAVPPEVAAAGAVYKVWGRAENDVWVVGTGGVTAHWDGSSWSTVAAPPTTLLTVAGDANAVHAVGGFANALALSYENGAWIDESPALAPQLNGVAVGPEGQAVAVGAKGAWYDRDGGAWVLAPQPPATSLDYHAAWIDTFGGVWAVGGHLIGRPLDQGVLVYIGPETIVEVE